MSEFASAPSISKDKHRDEQQTVNCDEEELLITPLVSEESSSLRLSRLILCPPSVWPTVTFQNPNGGV